MKEDLTPINDKGQPHGLWEYYTRKGKLWYRIVYKNGKKNGFEEVYWVGKLKIKTYYL